MDFVLKLLDFLTVSFGVSFLGFFFFFNNLVMIKTLKVFTPNYTDN